MKFQQLPIGTRFEYEGKVYVKTGPVSAASDQGGQRLIPRFAVLKPLDGTARADVPEKSDRKLDAAVVMAAFAVFCEECDGLLESAEAKSALAAARQRFEAALR